MNNPLATIKQFQTFVENFQKMNRDPRQTVQELMNSGQMSQQKFQELSQQATNILGRSPFGGKL